MKNFIARLFDYLKHSFLNGLLVILPITLTIAVFTYAFKLFKSWLTPIHRLEPAFLQKIPHFEFIVVLAFIVIIGALFKNFIAHSLLHSFEAIFFKIPLMHPIYFGIKQLVQAFTVKDKLTFKKVVLVEFPIAGKYSIGFLTGELQPELSPDKSKKYYNVFIPTTPNPTSGFLVIVVEDDIREIELSRQEAMSLVISGGIVQPTRFTHHTPDLK